MRPRRLILMTLPRALVVALLLALIVPTTASAWRVRVTHKSWEQRTEFEIRGCFDCSGALTIRRNGKVVARRYLPSYGGERSYQWDCWRRTGRHRWVVRSRGEKRSGTFTVRKCFISKRRARTMIREAVYSDAREDGYRVSRLLISDCRYGRAGTWDRLQWLCDLQAEVIENGNRNSYCGYGKVVKIGGRPRPSFAAYQYKC